MRASSNYERREFIVDRKPCQRCGKVVNVKVVRWRIVGLAWVQTPPGLEAHECPKRRLCRDCGLWAAERHSDCSKRLLCVVDGCEAPAYRGYKCALHDETLAAERKRKAELRKQVPFVVNRGLAKGCCSVSTRQIIDSVGDACGAEAAEQVARMLNA